MYITKYTYIHSYVAAKETLHISILMAPGLVDSCPKQITMLHYPCIHYLCMMVSLSLYLLQQSTLADRDVVGCTEHAVTTLNGYAYVSTANTPYMYTHTAESRLLLVFQCHNGAT